MTTEAGITDNMSRVEKCIDIEPMESFFGHFKSGHYDLRQYKLYEELVEDIDRYI